MILFLHLSAKTAAELEVLVPIIEDALVSISRGDVPPS